MSILQKTRWMSNQPCEENYEIWKHRNNSVSSEVMNDTSGSECINCLSRIRHSAFTWCLCRHEKGFSPLYFRPCRRMRLCFFLLFSCLRRVPDVALLLSKTQCDNRSFVFFISRGSLLCFGPQVLRSTEEKEKKSCRFSTTFYLYHANASILTLRCLAQRNLWFTRDIAFLVTRGLSNSDESIREDLASRTKDRNLLVQW